MKSTAAVEQPPSPDDPANWASQIRMCANATVVPSDDRGTVQECGVFDDKMNFCHDAVVWRRRPLMIPPKTPQASDIKEHLRGTYLWGGVIHAHFGHFLVESLGRIWGFGEVPANLDGILFLEKRSQKPRTGEEAVIWDTATPSVLNAFQKDIFAQLGINVPIGVVLEPTQVDRLWIPGQGFGMLKMAAGTPKYRKFVKDRFGRNIAPEGPKRIYISRSAYNARRGGAIGEPRLEKRLEKDGYYVFHPQKADVKVQIARYKAAEEIVALDGSALHLLAMVMEPSQKIAMIKRRSSTTSKGIETHLNSFSGKPPLVIDAIKQNWLRSDRKRVDRFSLAELDVPALGNALAGAGMATETNWSDLKPSEVDAILIDLQKDSPHRFRPQKGSSSQALPDGIAAACHGIEVPASSPVGPRWLVRKINNGRYEKEEIAGALHLISETDRVLECGAGIGIVGTVVAHNCKPAKMLSFEANPHMIEVIEATYRHNKVDDTISVTHGALMSGNDAPKTVDFNISKRFAFSSIDAPQRTLAKKVPVHNFAEVKHQFAPTALLMDIEGGELSFLRSADLAGINAVVIEFHPDIYGVEGMTECKNILRKAGFKPVEKRSTDTVWAAQRMA